MLAIGFHAIFIYFLKSQGLSGVLLAPRQALYVLPPVAHVAVVTVPLFDQFSPQRGVMRTARVLPRAKAVPARRCCLGWGSTPVFRDPGEDVPPGVGQTVVRVDDRETAVTDAVVQVAERQPRNSRQLPALPFLSWYIYASAFQRGQVPSWPLTQPIHPYFRSQKAGRGRPTRRRTDRCTR